MEITPAGEDGDAEQMKKVFLDYNATTPLDPAVLEAMMPYFRDRFGNASSIHSYGREAKAALDRAREQVASLLGAEPREIVFTSGGSEGANHVIKSVAFGLGEKGNHIVTTKTEHECVLESVRFLERSGCRVDYIEVDADGLPDPARIEDALTDKTVLLSCIFANNETGAVSPVEEIARIARDKGVLFHTDAVQAAGKLEIDLGKIPADFVTISSHKIYGPKGVGAVFIRDGAPGGLSMPPLVHGGGQERGKRSGTENIPGIAGFGEACEIARSRMAEDSERVLGLRNRLWDALKHNTEGLILNGSPENTLWNTLNFSVDGITGDSLSMSLDMAGVAVSTGSACSEGATDPSHVLTAMGRSKAEAASSIRISLGRYTEEDDIEYVSILMPKLINKIRNARL